MDDADGCQSVGWMVLRGEGTRARADRAAEWFRIPCERDVFDACAGLGFALLDDSASKSQADQGKHWLQVACEHDSAFGCLMAARRAAFEAQQLTPESRALFAKACRLGSKTACAEAQESEAPEGHSDAEESDSESD
jgi:TPR repeat protein